MATGNLQALSEQQIADCASNPHHCGGTGGCEGGTAQIAFQSVMDMGGISSEWTYPYLSYQGNDLTCKINSTTHRPPWPPAALVLDYVDIESNDEESLLEAVALMGPISISVDASPWVRYEAGIMDTCNTSSPSIDHAVQLVGYGEEKGEDGKMSNYWIVRNSWSPTWGEAGYIRVERGAGSTKCGWDTAPLDGSGCTGGPDKVYVCGMCGILYDNAFPLMDTGKKM
jgi:cathepsin L